MRLRPSVPASGQPWKALARPRSRDAWDRLRWIQARGLQRLPALPGEESCREAACPAREAPYQQPLLPKQFRRLREVQRISERDDLHITKAEKTNQQTVNFLSFGLN